jgi:hypothetical protein
MALQSVSLCFQSLQLPGFALSLKRLDREWNGGHDIIRFRVEDGKERGKLVGCSAVRWKDEVEYSGVEPVRFSEDTV